MFVSNDTCVVQYVQPPQYILRTAPTDEKNDISRTESVRLSKIGNLGFAGLYDNYNYGVHTVRSTYVWVFIYSYIQYCIEI